MQPIAEWLAKIGLQRYAAAFADNDIDVMVLRHLTDADLEKIGVSLGHRRKLLAAIAELGAAAPASPQPALAEPKSQDAAERRQVTVMFSDLVGSTALSARMDPEDLREVISAYQKCVAETVRRFGGFVAKYLGDGVLVYFGYPQAHEDDAERAVRAGLELNAASAVRRRILRRACKASPNRTWWSSPRARANFSATYSSSRTSGQKTSRASPRRRRRGPRCGQVLWKAASRRCTRPA